MSILEFISGLGTQFLSGFKSVNNGELINIMSNGGNMATITRYVSQVLFNRSRYSPVYTNQIYQLDNLTAVNNPIIITTGFSIFWLICLAILFFFILIAVCYHSHKENVQAKINNEIVIKINKRKKIVKKLWKKVVISLVSVGFVLWSVSFCFWCFEQSVTNSKLTQNNSTKSSSKHYNRLSNAVEWSFIYISEMYNVLTEDSLRFISVSVANISTGLTNQISNSVSEFANTILQHLHVSDIFNGANTLTYGLTILINSMDYIYNNNKMIIRSINIVKGKIATHQNNIEHDLNQICNRIIVQSLKNNCSRLQVMNSQFQTLINTSRINTDTSVIMLFLLQQYKINITTITQNYHKVYSEFNNNLNTTFQTAKGSVNVESYLNFFHSIWNSSVIPMITPIFNLVFSYRNDSMTILSKVETYENILIIVLIIIIFLLITLSLVSFYQEIINNRPWNKFANLVIYIFLVLFSLISAIVAIALILMTTYLDDQVCHQFNSTEGIQLSDQMVNEKLILPWKQFSSDISKNIKTISINLMQPMNVISGINTRCRNTSIGLFTAMGMKNFVNISQILQNSGIKNTLIETRNTAFNAFLKVNPTQVIPSDIVSFINQTKSLTVIFDSVDYTSSINELSIPLSGMENFTRYFESLSIFIKDANPLLNSMTEFISLSNTFRQLLPQVNEFNEVQSQVLTLKEHFLNLQLYRNNSQLMNKLSADIDTANRMFNDPINVRSIFNTNFDQIIMTNMLATIDQILNINFTSITSQLAPCGNLSFFWEAITTTMCSDNNLLDTLSTLGLLIIMVIVMCQVLLLLVVFATLIRIQFPKNHSKC